MAESSSLVVRSLTEILSEFPPGILDRQCEESHLVRLVHFINTETMVLIATDLELVPVDVDDIQTAWPRKPAVQRLEMFKRWREIKGSRATYRKLITVLHDAGRIDIIDSLQSILSAMPTQQIYCFESKEHIYGAYLKKRYLQACVPMPWNKWLPSPTEKIFNLAIFKRHRIQHGNIDDDFIQKMIHGQVDDILLERMPIKLDEIFFNMHKERKVVLINGAPGSGKSTLTVHICQRWSKGEVFQEFSIVILVQFRDIAVQQARCIADLLPCRDDKMAKDISRSITESDGRGILWILDGWDELPSHLRERSFLRDMIFPSTKSPTCLSSVIVTSRPILSDDLNEIACSRVEILGFTLDEQMHYFVDCLNGDRKAAESIIKTLRENPAIEGSCYLPLNASITAHLYLSDGSLPHTVYEMFSTFIQHFLSRYLCEKLGKTQQEARLRSLDDLPPELQGPFIKMCELAFKATARNKIAFDLSDFDSTKDLPIICDIGLLTSTSSIVADGQIMYYNFLHASIQELLAAIHISRLTPSEQISTFDMLFGDCRFNSVIQFYAAITKLRTSRPLLSKLPSRLCPVPASVQDVVKSIIKKQRNLSLIFKPKPSLISLLHCLYEAQDPSLCHFVAQQMDNWLNLYNTSLSPLDGLAIGYFLTSVSRNNTKVFRTNLNNCLLGDKGVKNLVNSIIRSIDHSTGEDGRLIVLSLDKNEIHEEGASYISQMLNGSRLVKSLWLGRNPIGDNGLQKIFDGLKQNSSLKCLSISYCAMTDVGVTSLATALKSNSALKRLYIHGNNEITHDGVQVLVDVFSKSASLVQVVVPKFLKDNISLIVNGRRKQGGLAEIKFHV